MSQIPQQSRPASFDDDDLYRWSQEANAPRRKLPAWLLSFVLHVTLLTTMAVAIQNAPKGTASEPAREGGIVLARNNDGQREYFDSESDRPNEANDSAAEQMAAALPSAAEAALDFAGSLPQANDDERLGGTGDDMPNVDQLIGNPLGRGETPGGAAKTYVFGLPGEGSKFVYVFDRSGSMEGYGGRPLMAAKQELLASLQDLGDVHQFQIIFYNERPQVFNPLGGTPQLAFGNEQNKVLAQRFVGGIIADGGTRHMEPLLMALRMRPDVVFFLTDADEPQLTPDELQRIARANRGTSIHAIEFGFGPKRGGDNFLARLARQNNGQHVYVDISQLPRSR